MVAWGACGSTEEATTVLGAHNGAEEATSVLGARGGVGRSRRRRGKAVVVLALTMATMVLGERRRKATMVLGAHCGARPSANGTGRPRRRE